MAQVATSPDSSPPPPLPPRMQCAEPARARVPDGLADRGATAMHHELRATGPCDACDLSLHNANMAKLAA
eukprot:14851170-Alexandrium_andersonii.AAC.1